MKNFGEFATNHVIYISRKQHQTYTTFGISHASTARNTMQMFLIL